MTAPIIFAIPKGRILDEALPLMQAEANHIDTALAALLTDAPARA